MKKLHVKATFIEPCWAHGPQTPMWPASLSPASRRMPQPSRMKWRLLADLNKLLEEDEAAAAQDDPRKTAPAGKWCANSAAQAAESAAKEVRNNG